jgi:hypothetical protein
MKILELLTVRPDDGIAALATVAAMFIGMRLLYGAWPWENRKTWYRTKPFVPVMAAPEQINNEAKEAPTKSFVAVMALPEQSNSDTKETPVDTDSDHFDRKLIAANGESPTDKNASSTTCVTGRTPSALRKKGAAHPRPQVHHRQIEHPEDRASNNSGLISYGDSKRNADHASPDELKLHTPAN